MVSSEAQTVGLDELWRFLPIELFYFILKERETKPKEKQTQQPSPCSSPDRQYSPVQNWTGEAAAWKVKFIHLKKGLTVSDGEGGIGGGSNNPRP